MSSNAKIKTAAEPPGATAASSISGERRVLGGPLGSAVVAGCVMGGNMRSTRNQATQDLAKSMRRRSAWGVQEARRALGLSVVKMATLLGWSPSSIDNYEDEDIGSLPDYRRRQLDELLIERGLLGEVATRITARARTHMQLEERLGRTA